MKRVVAASLLKHTALPSMLLVCGINCMVAAHKMQGIGVFAFMLSIAVTVFGVATFCALIWAAVLNYNRENQP